MSLVLEEHVFSHRWVKGREVGILRTQGWTIHQICVYEFLQYNELYIITVCVWEKG